MRIKTEGDRLEVRRNKRRGTKLRVVRGSRLSSDCQNCDLYPYQKNSLCFGFFHLCDYLRENDLMYGNFWFKLI
jgi:hypothetical protein